MFPPQCHVEPFIVPLHWMQQGQGRTQGPGHQASGIRLQEIPELKGEFCTHPFLTPAGWGLGPDAWSQKV